MEQSKLSHFTKTWLLMVFINISSTLPTYAAHIGKLSLGILSPQGFVGANYENSSEVKNDYSYSPIVGLGIDILGLMKTAGARGYKYYEVDHTKWYNRCGVFIFKNCKQAYSLSGYVHHLNDGTTMVDKSGNNMKFSNESGWLSSLALGTRSIIHEKWILDFEISKRFLLNGMEVSKEKGSTDSSERQNIEDLRTAYGLSFGVGYMW